MAETPSFGAQRPFNPAAMAALRRRPQAEAPATPAARERRRLDPQAVTDRYVGIGRRVLDGVLDGLLPQYNAIAERHGVKFRPSAPLALLFLAREELRALITRDNAPTEAEAEAGLETWLRGALAASPADGDRLRAPQTAIAGGLQHHGWRRTDSKASAGMRASLYLQEHPELRADKTYLQQQQGSYLPGTAPVLRISPGRFTVGRDVVTSGDVTEILRPVREDFYAIGLAGITEIPLGGVELIRHEAAT